MDATTDEPITQFIWCGVLAEKKGTLEHYSKINDLIFQKRNTELINRKINSWGVYLSVPKVPLCSVLDLKKGTLRT